MLSKVVPSADNQEDSLKDLILIQALRMALWWISELFVWLSEGASADAVVRRNPDVEVPEGAGGRIRERLRDLGL